MLLGVDTRVTTVDEEDRATAATPEARRRAVAAVVVGLVVALALRVPFVEAYLPWQHHWDEITNVEVGQRMAADLSPDPGFYDYPALVFLTQALVLVPAEHLGGYEPDTVDVIEEQTPGNGSVREPGLLRAMRWTTALVPSLVTVAAAGWLAWLLSARWWAAGLAALLAALSAVDLRHGMVVTPDALSGTGTALTLVAAVMLTRRPTRRAYVLAGAALGLAAAAKYNAVIVVAAPVLAHLMAHRRLLDEWRQLLRMAGAATLVFAVLNLGAVLHPFRFVQELGSEGVHYGSGHFGNEGDSPLFNAGWLWRSFGLGLLLGIASVLSRSSRGRRAAAVVGGFALAYYVFVSAFPVRFARNLLPLTAAVAALAAAGVAVLVERLVERGVTVRGTRALGALAGVLVLAVPVVSARAAVSSLGDDPWRETQEWLAANVPAGATIAVEAWGPHVDESRYEVIPVVTLGGLGPSYYEERGVDYLIAASERFEPYLDDPDEAPAVTAAYSFLLQPRCVVFEAERADRSIVVARTAPC